MVIAVGNEALFRVGVFLLLLLLFLDLFLRAADSHGKSEQKRGICLLSFPSLCLFSVKNCHLKPFFLSKAPSQLQTAQTQSQERRG